MPLGYALLCFAAALLQAAYNLSPASEPAASAARMRKMLGSPLWMSSDVGGLVMGISTVATMIAVPVAGWVLFRWYYGLLGFLFAAVLGRRFRGSNPFPPFAAGVLILTASLFLLLR
jgi:hypothetical protein